MLDVQMLPLRNPPRHARSVGLRTGLPLPQQPPLRTELSLPRKNISFVVYRSQGILSRSRLPVALSRPLPKPFQKKFIQKERYFGIHTLGVSFG